MNRQDITKIIKSEKVVAILRAKNEADIAPVVDTLVDSDIKVLEITSNTPGYLTGITATKEKYPNILIGAGTVINTTIAEAAIKAGAQFLVTPNTNVDVIKFAHTHNIPVLVGALTPTEVCVAHENGADVIKLFPAGNFGVSYFKSVMGPLNNIEYFAVGGIKTNNTKEWFDAGAKGVGYGCVKYNTNGEVDLEATKKEAVEILKKANS